MNCRPGIITDHSPRATLFMPPARCMSAADSDLIDLLGDADLPLPLSALRMTAFITRTDTGEIAVLS